VKPEDRKSHAEEKTET